MKKLYTTFFLSLTTLVLFAQNGRKASLSDFSAPCKSCGISSEVVIDTVCNFEADDTLAIYYADMNPYDSGWAIGHNAYQDKAWAERYAVTGSASVLGGAYLLYEKSGSASSGGTAIGKVYNTSGTGGKPGATALGQANIPFASMTLTGAGPTLFAFSAPVAVSNSFFMAFELGNYTLTGPDTIGVITSRHNNRSTSNADQNCAQFSDNSWNFELTENFKLKVTYGLCAIVDIAGGVDNFVTKGDLSLYAAYPSPASSEVNLHFSLSNANATTVSIYDETGKKIQDLNFGTLSAGTHVKKVDVSSYAAGNYLYSVVTENGTVFSRFSVVR